VDYDPLPVVTDPEKALEGGPFVHEKSAPTRSATGRLGGGDLEAGFAQADVIIERRIINHRMAGAGDRAARVLAQYRGGKLTVWSSTQVPHFLRLFLTICVGIPEGQGSRDRPRGRWRLRLEAPDLRGGDRLARGRRASSTGL